MNKTLKIKQTDEQKVYFTSDTHWFHNREFVWEARGYTSSNAHTDAGIAKVNEIVRPNDILFHLGDITLNCVESQFEEMLSRIQCQNIYHLWGNHNNPANKIYQREVKTTLDNLADSYDVFDVEAGIEIYPFRYRSMIFLGNYAEVDVDGKYFVLSHYPMYVFNYMKDEAMHLCGHSHYNLPLSQADDPSSKILDVGWDGWARPLSVLEVVEIMKKKGTLKVDHHQKEQISI